MATFADRRVEGDTESTVKTMSGMRRIPNAERPYLAELFGVTETGVFGSYMRGDQRPGSDIDILIESCQLASRVELLKAGILPGC